MAKRVVVTCPHCASTINFECHYSEGDGTQSARCRECYKTCLVYIHKGEVNRVVAK